MPEEYATKADVGRLLDRIEAVKTTLLEHNEATETKLLKDFRKWAVSFESRFRANEVLVSGFSERMANLEERVSDLERK